MPSAAPLRRASRPVWIAVAVLLALHYAVAVGSKLHESTTSDELAHMVGGFSYWKFDDYRLQPENGNLPQRWAALPAWLEGTRFPGLKDNPYWRTFDTWVVGHQFFYETGDDHFPRLMAGRAMIALFSVATGLLVFAWSRSLFGTPGAFVSLAFFVFSPTFLAHGALTTSDACMAFFMLASAGLWWRQLNGGGAAALALSAATFALACVAKFSAVLLLPMMAAMAMVRILAPAPLLLFGRTFTTRSGKAGGIALSAAVHGGAAVLMIWAFFGFRYSAFNPALPPVEHFPQIFGGILSLIGWQGAVIRRMAAWHLLPEAYLYGYAFVVEMSHQRGAFLNGEYSTTGWPSFFIWTFAFKTTIPLMIALVATAVVAGRRWAAKGAARIWRRDLYPMTPLLVVFAVYWAFSITSHLNIGHRHILPTYPILFIGVGALGWRCFNRPAEPGRSAARSSAGAFAIVALLVVGQIWECVRIAPHFIAYFNEMAGDLEDAHRHLVDSSLDWGQDLPGLKAWIDANARPGEPVFMAYFGTGEPDYYGFHVKRLPFINGFKQIQPCVRLEPGLYCISASSLEQVYSPVRGPWTLEREKEYQWLRGFEPLFEAYALDPARRAALEAQLPRDKWQNSWRRFDILRLARMCHYLRVRRPDGVIGYSILVYRLSAAEIAGATGGSLRDWSALIEGAVARRSAKPASP